MKHFRRVLVANRGEIALRVIRALKLLDIQSVAIFSDADAPALHVTQADFCYNLPGVYPSDTYLNLEKIIEIASRSNCDAIHPGYGFLSENAGFSRRCKEESIKFIGPSPETLENSGNKLECKKLVESRGVPVIPYTKDPVEDASEAEKLADEIGFPVLLKSAFGGGGRGIREASNRREVREAFESSAREARGAFGRFALYIEKKLSNPRHIEIQILADDSGSKVIHLGERECSIQRRYQKLVEISPSPIVDEKTRSVVASYAIKAAKAVRYSNAGTVEFLRDSRTGKFFFIEINSRLQVEHPVTEFVTGVDLVQSQVLIAEGRGRNDLPILQGQRKVKFGGSAIECRINAEDPLENFVPSSGKLVDYHLPGGPGVRVDTAIYRGMELSQFYDSLIAKLISFAPDFEKARRKMLEALKEIAVVGIRTTIPLHLEIMQDSSFKSGRLSTSFIEERRIIERMKTRQLERTVQEENYAVAAFLLSSLASKTGEQEEDEREKITVTQRSPARGRFVDGL